MDKDIYIALGLMSGTSLDGVDVATIETDGIDIFGFGKTTEAVFSKGDKEVLQSATQDALKWRFSGPPPNSFAQAEDVIDRVHIDAVGDLSADIVGYHGQTILHHPPIDGQLGQTLQLGRGQPLVNALGVPVVYDFRTADVEAGGQGAPLAPIYHEALCRYSNLSGRIAVLNIGGVSNLTLIEDGKLQWATDCGPGNGPLDSWIASNGAGDFDRDGQVSFAGQVDHQLIDQWFTRDFFRRSVPRSADRYDFDVLEELNGASLQDGAATLAAFCAQSIARDLALGAVDYVVVCGGGRKNPAIMAMLDMHTEAKVVSAEDVAWNGDMLEAQAFAYLAVRSLKGLPISFPSTTGVPSPMTGGQVIYPEDSLFGIAYGTTTVEPLEIDWHAVEYKIFNGAVDTEVMIAMALSEDMVPNHVDRQKLLELYFPLYQNYLRNAVAVAEKEWSEKYGDADPEEILRQHLNKD